jgi:hypothetical protein
MTDPDTTVVDYGRRTTNLEDVFLGLIERQSN